MVVFAVLAVADVDHTGRDQGHGDGYGQESLRFRIIDYVLTVPALDVLHKGGQAGCRGQVVRQGSAKPSFPGSNPGGTSNMA